MVKFLLKISIFLFMASLAFGQHPETVDSAEGEDFLNEDSNERIAHFSPTERHFMFAFAYSQVSPLGEFRDNTSAVFHGISTYANWFLDRQNVAVGFAWNFHTYDPSPGDGSYDNLVFGFDQILTNIKFLTNNGFLQPYIEAFVGLNWLYIDEQSHIQSIFQGAVEEELGIENQYLAIDDAASLAYGLGAGILLPFDFPNPNGPGAYLEFGVRYTFSNATRYMGNNTGSYLHNSHTNNFTFSAGFLLIF